MAYFSSDGQLMVPNDASYENISDYDARISQHLNPDVFEPNIEASYLATDATSLVSDGVYFQKNSNINVESYQNLPSSPLSFSSSNKSDFAVEGFDQVAHRRGRRRRDQDASGIFSKEWELLDYLPQMSKKPRLKLSHTSSALNQHFIQQPLQRREPLLFQNYNQQMNALLQQHSLQIMKEKNRLIQSISQYMGGPSQQQINLYLQQQMAKCSVPVTIPVRSGVCSRRFLQFLYHLQQRPSVLFGCNIYANKSHCLGAGVHLVDQINNIKYWRKFVAEYYAVRGKKRWCLSLYKDVGERALGVVSQEAWHCDMCGSKSGKGFEANFEILPRLYKTYFDSGILDELLFVDLPHEYVLPSGLIVLRYEKAVQQTIYEHFRVVREGQLRIVFRNDLKILAWEFCARCHDEVVPRSLVAPQVNELVQAAEKCQFKGGSSVVAVKNLQSTCKKFVATEGQLMKNLDLLLVNDLGFPKTYVRCLQTAEIVSSMKDLMTFSRDNNIGPIESLKKYSREGTIGESEKKQSEIPVSSEMNCHQKTQCWSSNSEKQKPSGSMNAIPVSSETVVSGSKQTAYGEINCHQEIQSCSSNSKKQKTSGSVNYAVANANSTPIPDPKSTIRSLIQRSPVSCSSSSTFSDCNDKEQMIDKILQQMESNTRDQSDMSKIVKVKEEIIDYSDGGSTDNVVIRNTCKGVIANTNTPVWKKVPGNASKKRENTKSAIGYICGKEEPDMEDIFKDLYLPETIKDVDRGFFRMGGLNDEWNEIGWKGKH